MGQRKNLSPRQDSNIWPPKHRTDALSTWATENSWRARPYSYFEKGCRKKCTRQSRKVLWVVLSSLFFKKFERMARETMDQYVRAAKGKQQLKVGSTATVSGTVYWLYPISPFGIVVHIFSDNLSRNSCILGSYLTRVLHTAGISNVDVSLCAEWMKDCKSSFFSWIIDFLSFKKRPNINLYLEYSWTSISI